MITKTSAESLLISHDETPLIDVRTPAEFEHGHVPGAYNIPLFSNEERVQVGTTYKQGSREEAILLGFDLTGTKWSGFIKQALEISPDKKVAVHCWRGGMRSGAMAWALDLYGFNVKLINGGYKFYRRQVLHQFETTYPIIILGGFTGSGKTDILHQLKDLGEQIIDLEDLAQHQGSSYGTVNKLVQPSQEQFENNLAAQLSTLDLTRPIWVEDESLTIGKRFIPKPFWEQMQKAPVININIPQAQRIELLANTYGKLDKEFLIECTERIWKRLGPEQTKNAVAAIKEDRIAEFVKLVLVYYDKTYRTSLQKRKHTKIYPLNLTGTETVVNAEAVLNYTQEVLPKLFENGN